MLADKLSSGTYRKIMVMGGVDTGKSWMALRMGEVLSQRGMRVALLSLDPGQASVGPPAVLGLELPLRPDSRLLFPTAMVFLGYLSPPWDAGGFIEASEKIVRRAAELAYDVMLADTCGMIAGGFARAIKQQEIKILGPDLIVSLDREGETRHIFDDFQKTGKGELVYLTPSQDVVAKSREQRARYRADLFARYFAAPADLEVSLDRLRLVPTSRRLPHGARFLRPGHLLALNDLDGFALSLAVLEARKGKRLKLITPYRGPAGDIKAIAMGPSVIDHSYRTALIRLEE